MKTTAAPRQFSGVFGSQVPYPTAGDDGHASFGRVSMTHPARAKRAAMGRCWLSPSHDYTAHLSETND